MMIENKKGAVGNLAPNCTNEPDNGNGENAMPSDEEMNSEEKATI